MLISPLIMLQNPQFCIFGVLVGGRKGTPPILAGGLYMNPLLFAYDFLPAGFRRAC